MAFPGALICKSSRRSLIAIPHLLTAAGDYVESQQSAAFPFLAMTEVERFLALRVGESATALIRHFRAWVRQQIATN